MKKTVHILISLFVFALVIIPTVHADWWDRPDARPTQPSVNRDLPTSTPPADPGEPTQGPTNQPTQGPTTPPSQPTAVPTIGGGGLEVTPTPITGGQGGPVSSSSDDPCASGKSFSGPYCGWSPGVGGTSSSGGGSSISQVQLVKASPKIKGLSKTSSGDVTPSDIILLTGILCLLLYVKSKTEQTKAL